ncbi:MAG: hypothetical protein K2J31_01750 [Alistipes sp.]|nr:hypothetical protein [Alistipes sp.]MDE6861453.1 hypothetical protein [Alistipes sp.]
MNTEILRGGEIYIAPELKSLEVHFERGFEATGYGSSGSANWAYDDVNDMGEF